MSRKLGWITCVIVVTLLSMSVFFMYRSMQGGSRLRLTTPISSTDKTVPMPQSECANLVAALKAYAGTPKGQEILLSEYHTQANEITRLTSKDCETKFSNLMRHVSPSRTHAQQGLMSLLTLLSPANTYCQSDPGQGEWEKMDLVINTPRGAITTGTVYVSVGMCWDGNAAWPTWGPDCQITMFPGLGGDITWCGVYNSGNFTTTPGANFDIYPWSDPLFKRYGYMRFAFYGDGTSTNVWGDCCH